MRALIAIVLGVLLATPAMAQWVEQGDAGDLPATAQVPAGAGALATISGFLDASDADMYCIHVDDVAAFSASTCTGATWDTQLFVFNPDGSGVKTNDDACSLQSTVADLAECGAGPGQYYLAISRFNWDPKDASGANVFSTSNGCNTNTNTVAGWGTSSSAAGDYRIDLVGVSFCGGSTPVEPTTWGNIKSVYR